MSQDYVEHLPASGAKAPAATPRKPAEGERRLMIVDDDPGIVRSLKWALDGYALETAGSRPEALEKLETFQPQVVTLDLGLPPHPDEATEGLTALSEILRRAPGTKVIVVSGNNDRQNAVKAVSLGAYDFYEKPIDAEVLQLIIDRAFNLWQLEEDNKRLQAEQTGVFHGIMTAADSIEALFRTVEKVAKTDISVLILGESGTGKELFAKALHKASPRASGPFIAINCGAIPENLLESELFGHEKGAFTGAVRTVKGKIENANGGTLFLDEIGDMPLQLQVKLLRFLQERVIERVGGREQIAVDVRIVTATHRHIRDLIENGDFREDLYYRISEITLDIPPLRERDDDAVVLAQYFIDIFARESGLRRLTLSPDAQSAIRKYSWPGNVRELENKMKRAMVLADGDMITAADLQLGVTPQKPGRMTLKDAREAAERAALRDALDTTDGNLSQAAKLLGVSRPTIYNLIKQLDMKV